MDLHPYADTGLTVTPLGLGLAALGRPAYINLGHADDLQRSYEVEAMREHAHQLLDAAWEAGIRYFDAARSYGLAEDFLGSWLTARSIPPTDVTIGSKWGYTYTADWRLQVPEGEKHEVKDHSLPVLNRQIEESRAALGDHLQVYHIHSATLESGVLENDDVLSRLAELRDAGLVVGFSTSGPQQADVIRRSLEIERDGRPVFASVQSTWNLLEPSAGRALVEAGQAGYGIIIKESLANGRLTERNIDPEFRTRHALLFDLAERHGVSVDAVAIACAVQAWPESVVLSGAAAVEHLQSNLQALHLVDSLPLEELLSTSESADEYWSHRSQLAWN